MNRDRFRQTGSNTFTTGAGAQAGAVDLQRYLSSPRASGIDEGGGASVNRYFISGVGPEYLSCYASQDSGGIDSNAGLVYVAKPVALRQSNYDGRLLSGWRYSYITDAQRERTWEGGGSGTLINGATILERIEPEFETIPGAVHGTDYGDRYCIFAVSVSEQIGVSGPGGLLTLLDINVDARAFYAEPNVFQVCVNGVARNVLILGGPPF